MSHDKVLAHRTDWLTCLNGAELAAWDIGYRRIGLVNYLGILDTARVVSTLDRPHVFSQEREHCFQYLDELLFGLTFPPKMTSVELMISLYRLDCLYHPTSAKLQYIRRQPARQISIHDALIQGSSVWRAFLIAGLYKELRYLTAQDVERLPELTTWLVRLAGASYTLVDSMYTTNWRWAWSPTAAHRPIVFQETYY